MVLRKAAMVLLLLRIVANRRSWNRAAIAQAAVRIRELLLKYPLLASLLIPAEKNVAALLQKTRGEIARAAVALQGKMQLEGIADARCVQIFLAVLKNVVEIGLQIIIKIDLALKTLAPFARYRIVCNVMRSKQRMCTAATCSTAQPSPSHFPILAFTIKVPIQ
jgi:hypothetical protein